MTFLTCTALLALAAFYKGDDGVVRVPSEKLASYSHEQRNEARRCMRKHKVRYVIVKTKRVK